MNLAIQQLIRGAVLRVLDDTNITSSDERERILARAQDEAERYLRQVDLGDAACADPMGGLRGMRHDDSVAMVRQCAAEAGIEDEVVAGFDAQAWNLLHRLAHAASKHGAMEREKALRSLGLSPSAVTMELVKRDAHGLRKYGVSLDRSDLSTEQWLQHLAEELLDGAGYALAAKRKLEQAPIAVEIKPAELHAIFMGKLQRAVDGLQPQAEGKSDDWKAGVLALVAALQSP